MEKKLKFSGIVICTLGFISVGWMVYNVFAYGYIRQQSPLSERLGMYVALGFLIAFLFHLIALVTIFVFFQCVKKITAFSLITLISGVISFITFIGEWAALNDIGDCLQLGLACTSEWTLLYLAFFPHGLFYILLIGLMLKTFRQFPKGAQPEVVFKDETMFDIVHIVGVCCGLIGLGFTSMIFLFKVKPHILRWIVFPYCSFILFPYGLILFYWLVMKWKEKQREWYDEKQWQDIHKAGSTTMIVSIPLMTFMFALNYVITDSPSTIMWFPSYLFLILLGFSSTTLYYSRR
jgi:hypothetical protein